MHNPFDVKPLDIMNQQTIFAAFQFVLKVSTLELHTGEIDIKFLNCHLVSSLWPKASSQ